MSAILRKLPSKAIKQQAATIPYRINESGMVEVLLVSKTGKGWGLPKGGIGKFGNHHDAARHETLEEAGVLGELERSAIGSYRYVKQGRPHRVEVFPMRVTRMLGRWMEDGSRSRVWVPVAEAGRLVKSAAIQELLTCLRHRILIDAPLHLAA